MGPNLEACFQLHLNASYSDHLFIEYFWITKEVSPFHFHVSDVMLHADYQVICQNDT